MQFNGESLLTLIRQTTSPIELRRASVALEREATFRLHGKACTRRRLFRSRKTAAHSVASAVLRLKTPPGNSSSPAEAELGWPGSLND